MNERKNIWKKMCMGEKRKQRINFWDSILRKVYKFEGRGKSKIDFK